MQETWVRSLVREDPTCPRVTEAHVPPIEPVLQSLGTTTTETLHPRAHASTSKEPTAMRSLHTTTREQPHSPQLETSPCSSEDLAQPKNKKDFGTKCIANVLEFLVRFRPFSPPSTPHFFFQHVTCHGHHPFLIIGLLVEDAEAIIKFMTQSPCWVLYWVFPSNNISNQGGKNLVEMVGDHYLRAFQRDDLYQGTIISKNNIVFQNSLLDLTFLTANWYCFFKIVHPL